MRNALLHFFGLHLFVLSPYAFATLENPALLPFGEREVLTGNAGIAGAPSSAAVFYNPAGLSLLKQSSLSVSGSTYMLQDVKASPLFRVDGSDEDYSASGFDSIPATVISVTRWSDWALAFSVLIPEVLKLNNRISFTTPNTKSSVINLTAAVGLRWHPAEFVDLGLRVRLPSIHFSGSGDGFNYQQTTNGTVQTIASKEEKKWRPAPLSRLMPGWGPPGILAKRCDCLLT